MKVLIRNPKRIFLLDGLGAFLTMFFLVTVLSIFEEYLGMPQPILTFLSILALAYAIYSFFCFYLIRNNWRPFLKIICIANLLYCCLTIGIVIHCYAKLTVLGVIYFLIEIILILGLVLLEQKALNSRIDEY